MLGVFQVCRWAKWSNKVYDNLNFVIEGAEKIEEVSWLWKMSFKFKRKIKIKIERKQSTVFLQNSKFNGFCKKNSKFNAFF